MGFFSFLKKKEASPAKGGIEPLKLDLNLPPIENIKPSSSAPLTPELGSPFPNIAPSPSFEQPSAFRDQESYKSDIAAKDLSRSIELLSSKLDTIKVMLDNLNHRLDKMESSQKKETIRW